MPQLVFLHGPGAGGCAEAFRYQLDYFRSSLAPTLPGHGAGVSCASIERYTEWVRGGLWAQGRHHDLVLVGYTLGACIALQYGLDYPEEVSGLVLMTVAMRESMRFVAPELREHLIACHHQVGPRSQHHDLVMIDQFDVRHRISTLTP